jgi:hypothetical protein
MRGAASNPRWIKRGLDVMIELLKVDDATTANRLLRGTEIASMKDRHG